jgi:hypothetical protein
MYVFVTYAFWSMGGLGPPPIAPPILPCGACAIAPGSAAFAASLPSLGLRGMAFCQDVVPAGAALFPFAHPNQPAPMTAIPQTSTAIPTIVR